ncbi:MAG: hypothetical protein ABL949_00180 [Fimbriimonadaceae bacterium]
MKRNILLITSVVLMASAIAQTGRAEFIAQMTGAGKGKAVWKTRDSATQMQGELQIEGERMAKNIAVKVEIAGYSWNSNTDALGRFRIVQRFNTATRPNIAVGTAAVVKNSAGATLMSGSFAVK